MRRGRRDRYIRSVAMTYEEAVFLTALGGKSRPSAPETGAPPLGRAPIPRVLCWWCREYHDPAEVEKCMALERPQPVAEGGSTSSLTVKMPPWLQQFPELWEFLSKLSYKDGAPRQTGKITLQLVSEGIQVSLTDPSSSAYCCRRFKSLDDALVELELALESGMISWRPSGPPRCKKGR